VAESVKVYRGGVAVAVEVDAVAEVVEADPMQNDWHQGERIWFTKWRLKQKSEASRRIRG